jgi:hypothetical protein
VDLGLCLQKMNEEQLDFKEIIDLLHSSGAIIRPPVSRSQY